jgi:hypothetical protein
MRQPLPVLVVLVLVVAFILLLDFTALASSSSPTRGRRASRAAAAFLGRPRIGQRQRPPAAFTAATSSGSSPRHMAMAAATAAVGQEEEDPWVFDVLFTGTGQSSSVPLLKHIVEPGKCAVCDDALKRPGSKNKCVRGWVPLINPAIESSNFDGARRPSIHP